MLLVLFMLGVMYDYRAPLEDRVDPRCYLNEHIKAWVYFTDKGVAVEHYDDAIQAVENLEGEKLFQFQRLSNWVLLQ